MKPRSFTLIELFANLESDLIRIRRILIAKGQSRTDHGVSSVENALLHLGRLASEARLPLEQRSQICIQNSWRAVVKTAEPMSLFQRYKDDLGLRSEVKQLLTSSESASPSPP